MLNKYYPPDFDPSKVPKVKGNRNATFIIRVMAPCNMRCTTCGEYIYKGRKFNARKEDVDDMDYLGLRIYRFYIKCTACVSEICFRTDPESCDYVLEAGATRNFEALKRAEEQLEREDIARMEELENNPMKLLEERTAASKHEMDLAESLEELKELNRRKKEIDHDDMVNKYQQGKLAQSAEEEEMRRDEEFIAAVFRKDAVGGERVKRILDSSSGSEGEEPGGTTKVLKTANPTDHLVEKKEEKRKQVWDKSVGSLGSASKLGLLVKKKTPTTNGIGIDVKTVKSSLGTDKNQTEIKSPNYASVSSESSKTVTGKQGEAETSKQSSTSASTGPSGLGLLGAYSDSDTSSD